MEKLEVGLNVNIIDLLTDEQKIKLGNQLFTQLFNQIKTVKIKGIFDTTKMFNNIMADLVNGELTDDPLLEHIDMEKIGDELTKFFIKCLK